MIDEELRVDAEQLIEQIFIVEIPRPAQGTAGHVAHGIHAVLRQLLRVTAPHPPEICDGLMRPQQPAVSHLIQVRDAHAVPVRLDVLGHDIQRDLAKVHIGPDARRGCDACGIQNV